MKTLNRETTMNKWILCLLALCLCGCITSYSTHGTQIEEYMVAKIEKGETTRSNVLKWFGVPYKIVDAGSRVGLDLDTNGDVDPDGRAVSSVEINEEIYIYESSVESIEARFLLLSFEHSRRTSTLMIWIDRDTGIVQEYRYRK